MKTIKRFLFTFLLVVPCLLLAGEPIDVNTATRDELMALRGIGEIKAQAIIDYRTANGPFESLEDLDNVSGIGEKTMEANQDQWTIGQSPSTKE